MLNRSNELDKMRKNKIQRLNNTFNFVFAILCRAYIIVNGQERVDLVAEPRNVEEMLNVVNVTIARAVARFRP